MKFCTFNKKVFGENEEVKIFLEMKNINSIQVKIFQFEAENYYLKTNSSFDYNLDLDGLTANEENVFDFTSE